MARMLVVLVVAIVLAWSGPANAVPFFFSTGNVDGRIATASRPASAGKIEIESGDDFMVGGGTLNLNSATFQGLIPSGASLGDIGTVRVEIYRVFPADSNVGRSSGPPDFSVLPKVPTRVNSPSDVAFDSRESGGGRSRTRVASCAGEPAFHSQSHGSRLHRKNPVWVETRRPA